MENTQETSKKSMPTRGQWYSVKFNNPWKTWKLQMWTLFTNMRKAKNKNEFPLPKKEELEKTLPVTTYTGTELQDKFIGSEDNGIKMMWIGHASCLVQMNGINILTDPIFGDRCSPFPNTLGPIRYRPVPCNVDALPEIHAVVISHNHYDHLDFNTVCQLNERFKDKITWIVPLGMKSWIVKSIGSSTKCEELNWWDEYKYKGLTFVLTPAQHWCGRTPPLDYNQVLWGSWSILGPKHKFFFGGDTGYCEAFKEIGNIYGPFDLAAIPIGAYHPREALHHQHVDPKEAFQLHCDINSKESIGIHWGTFPLSYEHYLAPGKELYDARVKHNELEKENGNGGVANKPFYIINHGEIINSGQKIMSAEIQNDSFICKVNKI